ncbi:ribosomal protein S6 kinase beta-1 [Nephila pilipes]|uniref:Ribosomal protein S6 kinase beta-1 n=1 Tax=Nephila pilipes TaxID=299642 RepID=A0A8X6PG87_NEPPI|nr:ribosomal protein S6 kinase beta-1 [Nephila pilipes]
MDTSFCDQSNKGAVDMCFLLLEKLVAFDKALDEYRYCVLDDIKTIRKFIKGPDVLGKAHAILHRREEIQERRSEKTGPRDFKCLNVLGLGGFGKVLQVQKKTGKDAGKLFAMKVINKDKIQCQKDMAHMKAERNILQKIRHPFIVDFYYAFQTDHKLYLILEFLIGGDLFTLLEKKLMLSEDSARFYLGEIILALQHLHKEDIIYRDLKPENVLLDARGHVKLADFGLCKECICDGDNTHTFCGTVAYMAPEIVSYSGHGKAADWWSLGTLMYLTLTGQTPFRHKNKKKLMEKILKHKLVYPKYISKNAENLMRRLMKRCVNERLGSGLDGAEPIKNHRFFQKINWNCLLAKTVTPPYEPEFTSEDDVSQFDPMFTGITANDSTDDSVVSDSSNPFHGFTYEGNSSVDESLKDLLSPVKCISSPFCFKNTCNQYEEQVPALCVDHLPRNPIIPVHNHLTVKA